MRSPLTTLCYIEQGGKYLMLHRVSKKNDVNKDKWIGIGGHFEAGESPEECLLREAKEETGLTLTSWKFRGIVTFESLGVDQEYMCLYTADKFEGTLTGCSEGELEWVSKDKLISLNLWEGDKIFLKLIAEDAPFFSLKLTYRGDVLSYAALDGRGMELIDICDESGVPTGRVTERSVAHMLGTPHRTVHIWVVRKGENGNWEVLLQKRSAQKESFPLCYDTSSAGHVDAGEMTDEAGDGAGIDKTSAAEKDRIKAAALRELREELGIEASPEELELAGIFDGGNIKAEFNGKPVCDREFATVYVYRQAVNIEELTLQKEEVDSVRWMDYNECRMHTESKNASFCVHPEGLALLGRFLGM